MVDSLQQMVDAIPEEVLAQYRAAEKVADAHLHQR